MSWSLRNGVSVAGLALALMGAVMPAEAARIKVGDEIAYPVSTPRAYPLGGSTRPVAWTETVVSPGATFLRLHFQRFHLPDGDYLTVSNPDGSELWTYTGKGPQGTGEFWSFSVDGDTAILELHTGDRIEKGKARRYGASIDRIAHGSEPLWEEDPSKVICGTNGSKDAVCHSSVNTNPVARLSFQSGGASYVCTGWLVAGSNSSTLLTNNHCVATQTEVSTVQARFNYQRTTCGGSTTASYTTYAGGTFLRTSSSLDYTLLTLQGNPEATWGEYTATSKNPTAGMLIIFPQHPGGGVKKVGYYESSTGTTRCTAHSANVTISGYSSQSQMRYACDSEGGSSGSPIMDAGTGRIIGLHHLGSVGGSTCLNGATQMKNVCANAGSLLSCATN